MDSLLSGGPRLVRLGFVLGVLVVGVVVGGVVGGDGEERGAVSPGLEMCTTSKQLPGGAEHPHDEQLSKGPGLDPHGERLARGPEWDLTSENLLC